jgi:HK97 gp10 family phage protein
MGISIDTSEVRALAVGLRGAGKRVGARSATALRKAAHDIESDAKLLAPVDTGALKNSISTTITGDGRGWSMTAEIGPTVDYGIHQEYGTSTQSGTPFMGPAFDRRIPAFTEAMYAIGVQEAESA